MHYCCCDKFRGETENIRLEQLLQGFGIVVVKHGAVYDECLLKHEHGNGISKFIIRTIHPTKCELTAFNSGFEYSFSTLP